jgi:hypothetical protein
MFLILDFLIVAALLAAMLLVQRLGHRLGEAERRGAKTTQTKDAKDGDAKPSDAAEGAVYGVLALLLAFTFSGAGSRFEHRYQLGIDEANAIGTAWLRLDALPAPSQPALRELFRQYVDARLALAETTPLSAAYEAANANYRALQNKIWSSAVAALAASGQTPLYAVVLSPINEMIDLTSTRDATARLHPPVEVFVMLALFLLIGALYAGHSMAGRPRSRFQSLAFPLVLAIVIFVILDFEFPRLGFIRVSGVDAMLVDLRKSME